MGEDAQYNDGGEEEEKNHGGWGYLPYSIVLAKTSFSLANPYPSAD